MEPVMWLEILSRHHDVTARHRCGGAAIRIGRGYDNDIVLDDPFVAPYHLRVARAEDGGWVAQDLGTANGIRAEHGKARFETAGLDGERIIRIGHTLLRLRSTDHPVAAERLDKRRLPLWPVALLLISGIVGIELVSDWLSETAEPRLSAYLGGLVQIGTFAVGWVGLWTILCGSLPAKPGSSAI
ncbi:MAG: FHA domain-containing protein [Aliidongia sp.]